MDRRTFIKSSLLATGSLVFGSASLGLFPSCSGKRHSGLLPFPDRVTVDGIPLSMANGKFVSGDLLVSIDDGTVSLAGPSRPVSFVKLTWFTPLRSSVKVLGDHWERGYGDLEWKSVFPCGIIPSYFILYDGSRCTGYGVKTGCNAFCRWEYTPDSISLILDVRNGTGGVSLDGRKLHMATLVTLQSQEGQSPFSFARDFCGLMCDSPLLPSAPVYGINDWYFAYGRNSDALIMQTVEMMEGLVPDVSNRPFCLIDDGWAQQVPGLEARGAWADNYFTPNSKFPDMGSLASRIKKKDMRPGLWMRPLVAGPSVPDSLLLHGGDAPLRDPTLPENVEYLRKCFSTYKEWGYEMVKHDFSTYDIFGKWGFEMFSSGDMTSGSWAFHDRSITSAEAVKNLYKEIRSAAGDIILIGCNTFSHLSAGLFEIQRTGDDTSGREWARTLKMGVNTLAFRQCQHNVFYSADPDCVGLTTEVPWEKNRQWMNLVARSAAPLFISAQPEAMGPEQKESVRECFAIASVNDSVGEPLDWLASKTPSRWKLQGEIMEFDW